MGRAVSGTTPDSLADSPLESPVAQAEVLAGLLGLRN